jgi:hypothetical protein
VTGRPIRLPGFIGKRKLPLKILVRASEQIVRVSDILARFSKPRLRWLTGAAANLPYGIVVMVVSVLMSLPIPLVNAVPNVGLCVIAFSMLNRDGVGVVIGLVITALGVMIGAAALFGLFHLGAAAIGTMG